MVAVFSQLRLLLWKNLLIQWRSKWFTLLEFLMPIMFIVSSYSSLNGVKDQYEKNYSDIFFPNWLVTGRAYDFIMIVDPDRPKNDTILNMNYFLKYELGTCPFLKITQLSDKSYVVNLEIAYAPQTDDIDKIMSIVQARYTSDNVIPLLTKLNRTILSDGYSVKFVAKVSPFSDENALVKYVKESFADQCGNPLLGGIVFSTNFANNAQGTDDIAYTIRLANTKRRYRSLNTEDDDDGDNTVKYDPWDTTKQLFATTSVSGPVNPDDSDGGDPGYWQEGFLTLQRAIDASIGNFLMGKPGTDDDEDFVELQRFPFPAYKKRVFEIAVGFTPDVLVFSLLTTVIYIVRTIVMEKESNLKEYMKVMGLSQWIQWLAFFIINYAKILAVVGVLFGLTFIMVPNTNAALLVIFYMLFAFNVVYFAFLISTILNSGMGGTLLAVISWISLYVWENVFAGFDDAKVYSTSVRLLSSLNPLIALNLGLRLIEQFESQADGLHWNDLFHPPSPDRSLTMAHVYMMLIIDGVMLMVLTWYIEAVNPGGEGVPQKPWFFLQKSYWFPGSFKNAAFDNYGFAQNGHDNNNNLAKFEAEPSNLKATIKIQNLCKTYSSSIFKNVLHCQFERSQAKKAVDGLNLNVYESQITALLGHNGAGKSTTFSMLTGVIAPTAGTAIINDYDIRTSLGMIRKNVGICPQYNILFDDLTVMEHLEFFCKLKERQWYKAEAVRILEKLKIGFKQNAQARTLSGGQKRKLSLAIALIGGSEIITLDEPTSGMDPGARHETWGLLQEEKKTRTILLTTHFMEEADLLGDRIAIMAHGRLQCYGSSMFLKNLYKSGYMLTAEYKIPNQAVKYDTLMFLKTYCPEVEVNTDVGAEATFFLPGSYRPKFPEIFVRLEEAQRDLGIESFGISVTTMEDVFLKVDEEANKKRLDVAEINFRARALDNFTLLRNLPKLSFPLIYFQHANAMIRKRVMYYSRYWVQFILQLGIPIAIIALVVFGATTVPQPKDQPARAMDLADYSHKSHIANVFVVDYTDWLPKSATSLKDSVNGLLQNAFPGVEYDLQAPPALNETIISDQKVEGTRAFGVHSPAAFHVSQNPIYSSQGTGLRALFNNFGIHSPALVLSLADSLLLRRAIGRDITIKVTNHPLPPTSGDTIKNSGIAEFGGVGTIIGYGTIIAMSFILAGYCSFIIREKQKKFKHMQYLAGIQPWLYWTSIFVWDVISYFLPILAFIAIFAAYDIKPYIHNFNAIWTVLKSFLLLAWCYLPFVYWWSFSFASSAKGFASILIYSVISGLCGLLVVLIVQATSNGSVVAWHVVEIVMSSCFPMYGICNSLMKVYKNEASRLSCASVDCLISASSGCCGHERIYLDDIFSDFGHNGLRYIFVAMGIEGIIFWVFVFIREYDIFGLIGSCFSTIFGLCRRKSEKNGVEYDAQSVEDDDVVAEKSKVVSMNKRDAAVIVQNLKKEYGSNRAVKGVNFHLDHGECFGLLGVNGAGKTSTFTMLTHETSITSGNAYINGKSIKSTWRSVSNEKSFGYCPQYDAILKELTGEETLAMFARIRGYYGKNIDFMVDTIIDAIGIRMYAKRQIKTYSGGNKRRLSLGIALIGIPDVLLLDEPTTGVDPKARRLIWDILLKVRHLGSALVLTSHSMEESEALCTSLAIMVYGHFRCLGSSQHIKSRYGVGYTLLIKFDTSSNSSMIKQAIERTFPKAQLKEEHLNQLSYELQKSSGVTWSSLFAEMERLSQTLPIIDYSLSQTSLEQIFLKFSREADQIIARQEEEAEAAKQNQKRRNCCCRYFCCCCCCRSRRHRHESQSDDDLHL